jgi:hypothetical protein
MIKIAEVIASGDLAGISAGDLAEAGDLCFALLLLRSASSARALLRARRHTAGGDVLEGCTGACRHGLLLVSPRPGILRIAVAR